MLMMLMMLMLTVLLFVPHQSQSQPVLTGLVSEAQCRAGCLAGLEREEREEREEAVNTEQSFGNMMETGRLVYQCIDKVGLKQKTEGFTRKRPCQQLCILVICL